MTDIYIPKEEVFEADGPHRKFLEEKAAQEQKRLEEEKKKIEEEKLATIKREESFSRGIMEFKSESFERRIRREGLTQERISDLTRWQKFKRWKTSENKKDKDVEYYAPIIIKEKIPSIYVPEIGNVSTKLVCSGRTWEYSMKRVLEQGYSVLDMNEYIKMLTWAKRKNKSFLESLVRRGYGEHVDTMFTQGESSICVTYGHRLVDGTIAPDNKFMVSKKEGSNTKSLAPLYLQALERICPSLEGCLYIGNYQTIELSIPHFAMKNLEGDTRILQHIGVYDRDDGPTAVNFTTWSGDGSLTLQAHAINGHVHESKGIRLVQRVDENGRKL